ncbi:MAG TPA: Uma2 family endonuclease [Chthonomonadaceae bacterium]|nr:Uma2 family endonuclease [Chthonomonadaceae bacterium]
MVNATQLAQILADDDEDFYPSSDGMPMGESDIHIEVLLECKETLNSHFADRPDVYVAANNFLYWERRRRDAVVSPDCYVVFGVEKRLRNSYQVWEEGGRLPSVVFEITSKHTRLQDEGEKKRIYAMLGVSEYFLFDPTGDYLKPNLQGFRLQNGAYASIPLQNGRLICEQLQLELMAQGQRLRFYAPQQEVWLLNYQEQKDRADTEAKARQDVERQLTEEIGRADAEAKARTEAEAEIARLKAELEALRRKP